MSKVSPSEGDFVRIRGGFLCDPEGNGLLHETPGPIPSKLEGSIGVIVPFAAEHGLNIFAEIYPFDPWKSIILKNKSVEALENICIIRIIDGPLKGRLLNGDLLFFEVISPLEALAEQA